MSCFLSGGTPDWTPKLECQFCTRLVTLAHHTTYFCLKPSITQHLWNAGPFRGVIQPTKGQAPHTKYQCVLWQAPPDHNQKTQRRGVHWLYPHSDFQPRWLPAPPWAPPVSVLVPVPRLVQVSSLLPMARRQRLAATRCM